MAISSLPPHIATAMGGAKAEREAMNSPDPVTRYKARQNAADRAFMEFGAALVSDAKKNAKALQRIKESSK